MLYIPNLIISITRTDRSADSDKYVLWLFRHT